MAGLLIATLLVILASLGVLAIATYAPMDVKPTSGVPRPRWGIVTAVMIFTLLVGIGLILLDTGPSDDSTAVGEGPLQAIGTALVGGVVVGASILYSQNHLDDVRARRESDSQTASAYEFAIATTMDLSHWDLQGKQLTQKALAGRNLTETLLSRANLDRALLQKTLMIETQCMLARLSGANLTGAVIVRADLTGANLEGAALPDLLFDVDWDANTIWPDGFDPAQRILAPTDDGYDAEWLKVWRDLRSLAA